MLEDCTVSMEKKVSGRSIQPQGKSAGSESKKNQDVVGCKPGSRSRRREPSGPNPSSSKQEAARKSAAPKYKSLDKRPRPRGQYYSGGKEDTKVVTEENAEYGSVFTPGSKKQSLNHLLNFHYAPRGLTSQGSNSVPVWSRSQRWLSNTHKHKYNKEHFLQANCQFVVRSSGDYSAYLSNPDALVDWDHVEQIRVQSGETLSCPICLSPPVAAKMTRCGHIYCWPCILHYLALSDKTWRSCPICYEAIHINGLKSVVAIQQNALAVNDNVTMLLMCRERGSLVATPIGEYEYRLANPLLSVSETVVNTIYSKLLSAKPEEVIAILANERLQLETQLREDQGSPELCFTEQALELLSQRLTLLQNTSEQAVVADPQQTMLIQSMPTTDKYALVYDSAFDDSVITDTTQDRLEGEPGLEEHLSDQGNLEEMALSTEYQQQVLRGRYRCESGSSADAVTVDDLEIHHAQAAPQKQFYFYQASDGQHMYLHAMNVRMLEMQYGSLAACPRSISGRIVEKEAGSMNEELRKRLRYLQHLSITCQFEVAELDLRPPTITKEIMHHFQDQLEVRRRRRQSRAKQERRREKQITEVENRLLGRHPTPNVHIQSTRHFPQWGSEVPATSGSAPLSPVMSSLASSPRELNSPITAAMEALDIHPHHDQGPSFAQMLREGKSHPEVRKTVQAANLEDYDAAPSLGQSFSDAIALALEKVEQEQALGEAGLVSGKKKKKNKKKILFATSMVCSGK